MSYLGENRIEVDFWPNITSNNNYNVVANLVTFYNSKVIDFSDFSFLVSNKK